MVEIAGTIIHECGHLKTGGGDHCVAAGDVKLSCAACLYSDVFKHAIAAKLALPRGQLVGGTPVDPYAIWRVGQDPTAAAAAGRARGRFDYSAGDDSWFGFTTTAGAAAECQPYTVGGHHCELWTPNHGANWTYQIPQSLCVESVRELRGHLRFGPGCQAGSSGGSSGGGGSSWEPPPAFPPDPPFGGGEIPPPEAPDLGFEVLP